MPATSSVRTESTRRQSISARAKTRQNPVHTRQSLSLRPNAPFAPRAIFQATCGPVQAFRTRPFSSTSARAISPPAGESTCTVQIWASLERSARSLWDR